MIEDSTLSLLVTRIFADHEYLAPATYDLTRVANPLHTGTHLHDSPLQERFCL